MLPLVGVLSELYVPVRVTCGALVAHRCTYAPPRCRTSKYSRAFIPLSVSLCDVLGDPAFDGVVLASYKSLANDFSLVAQFLSPTGFPFSSFIL